MTRMDRIEWFHSIELGDGLRTPGSEYDLTEEQFPDFKGQTALDIGAWDGKYSFLAERLGATRVVALDHYAWGVDFRARAEYWAECRAARQLPDHSKDLTEFWQPHLPGQAGFNLAKAALSSSVEPVVADFMTMDLTSLGMFDIVLYLGVLYHVKEPVTALERVRQVTKGVAVIETAAVWIEGLETRPVLEFFVGDELNADFGNWYLPTLPALHALCRAVGFSKVRTIVGPPGHRPDDEDPPRSVRYRALVHAFV